MRLSAKEKITAGFITALILLSVLLLLIFYNSNSFISSSQSISTRQQILVYAEQILSQTIQVETNARGYALSTDEKFLKNNSDAKINVTRHVQLLKTLSNGDSRLKKRINVLEECVRNKIYFSDQVIDVVNENRTDSARTMVSSGQGQELMNAVAASINDIQNYEQQLLNKETKTTVRDTQNFYNVLNALFIIMMIFFVIVFYMVIKELEAKEKSRALIIESEKKFRVLAETANDAIIIADQQGKIIFINEAGEKIFGYSAADLTQKSIPFLMSEKYHATHLAGFQRYIKTGESKIIGQSIEISALRKSGEEFPIELSLGSWKNNHEVFFAAFIRDISKRKKAEELLHTSLREVFELYNTAPCGYHSLNNEGYFIEINKTELNWLGYERDEIIRKLRITDTMTPVSAERCEKLFPVLVKEGSIRDVEFEMKRKDGSVFPVLLSSIAIKDESGNFVRTRSTVFDLTQRKQQEETALQSKIYEQHLHRLEAEYQDMESFSYIASHDLKSPLNNLEGIMEHLSSMETVIPGSQEAAMLDVMRRLVNNMRKLINDLLAFSRIGKTTVKATHINMTELAHEVISELKMQSEYRKCEVIIKELLPAKGDAAMIRQVWTNFLSNAFKYCTELQKPLVEAGSYIKGSEKVYFVKDNGIGFDMKDYAKLFSAFKRLHGSENFAGTGIGLASVKRIVEKHNGRVWAEASPGKGATFYFALPA
jgi:PAS domain S-box-containing protein